MYDPICKFLVEHYSQDFATWLLGASEPLTEIKPSELSLEPIRADSIILLQSKQSILHLEFQTQPKRNIPFRVLDYWVRIHRIFPGKDIVQVVIYLEPTGSDRVYESAFVLGTTRHEFQVIRLWEQSPDLFLQAPGLWPFVMLTKVSDPEAMLRDLSQRIDQLSDPQMQSNVSAATAVLAGLVLDNEIINRILRKDIMRQSVIYQEIQEEAIAEHKQEWIQLGKQEGIQLGKEEGKQEGKQEGIQQVALNLLNTGMDPAKVSAVTGLTLEQVQQLALDSPSS
ncbi:MAG: Rpn family recombination-promoting nuclease/putative transposase [Cyanobacteriota bacterium]|nr:Rpn family recombination-promoting nuclease/putative transposase [Cyanobacteriota bacterium]